MDLEMDQKTNVDQKTLDQTLSIIYNNWFIPVSYWQHLVEEKNIPLSVQYHLGLFRKVNYPKAFELYEADIKLGNSYAINNLAYMYIKGQYVTQDYQKVFELYEEASKLGNSYSMSSLAKMYQNGHYVDRNYQKAFELYESASKLGNAIAMNDLGCMYYVGQYVAINYQKAFELFEEASKLKNAKAMNNLAVMYSKCRYAARNYQKAFELYESASNLGDNTAMKKIKDLYNNHANDLDFEQIIKYMKLMESNASITKVAIPKKFIHRMSQILALENNNKTLQQTIEELEHSPLPGVKFLETQRRFVEMSKDLSMDTDTTTESCIDTDTTTESGIDTV